MSDYISSSTADIIGFMGGFFIICAYAYSNISDNMNLLLFNILNFLGAAFLIISLTVNFNLPNMVLEIIWMAIAIFGIVKALLERRKSSKVETS